MGSTRTSCAAECNAAASCCGRAAHAVSPRAYRPDRQHAQVRSLQRELYPSPLESGAGLNSESLRERTRDIVMLACPDDGSFAYADLITEVLQALEITLA